MRLNLNFNWNNLNINFFSYMQQSNPVLCGKHLLFVVLGKVMVRFSQGLLVY
jgi:hypothetical protein